MFVRPLNVKDCLHKFCHKCIEDYNRKYNKCCPQCRTPIMSRRHLRNDHTLQSIISALIAGPLDKFNEVEQKRRVAEFNRTIKGQRYKEYWSKKK